MVRFLVALGLFLQMGCSTGSAPVREGSWDFGHHPLKISSRGENTKPAKITFHRDAKKTGYFLKSMFYEFEIPSRSQSTSYQIKTSDLNSAGCSQVASVKYLIDVGGVRTAAEPSRVFNVPAAQRATLVSEIANPGNCDHIDYTIAVERQ